MGNRILLADDSITIQKVVGIIFANEDCDLTVVDNGDSAVEKARETKPDVMLVDALMPGKSGYEVCTAIREDPLLCTVPILLMTGAFEPFDEEKARQCGADDFISKPFESQQLIDKVKGLLDLGKSRAVAAPAVAPAPAVAAAAVAAAVAPVAAEPVESFAIEFDEPVPVTPQPAMASPSRLEPATAGISIPEPQPFAFEIEEASPTDDLWGAFELEDEVTGEDVVEFGQVATGEAAAATTAASVPLGLEPTGDVFGVGSQPAAAEAVEFGVAPAGDEFVFMEEPDETAIFASGEPTPFTAPPLEEAFVFGEESAAGIEPYGTISEKQISEELVPAIEPFEASRQEEFTPAAESLAFVPLEEQAPAPFAAASSGVETGGTITLTEEQLAAAISRISREVIERIAWEVVPDLAETLIKEEIRRIKGGG